MKGLNEPAAAAGSALGNPLRTYVGHRIFPGEGRTQVFFFFFKRLLRFKSHAIEFFHLKCAFFFF